MQPAVPRASSQLVILMVQALGSRHMQLAGIITDHLLPALVSCNESAHVAFLGLIISSGLTASEAPDQSLAESIVSSLKSHGKVVTTHGVMQLQGSFLHLPVSLGNKVTRAPDLQHVVP